MNDDWLIGGHSTTALDHVQKVTVVSESDVAAVRRNRDQSGFGCTRVQRETETETELEVTHS